MNISAPFIRRPVATTLMAVALFIAGAMAFPALPVSSLPQVDFATITVESSLPGASPEIMAASVATPLERQFGRIAGVNQMTSSSTLGGTLITLQFDLTRDVDGAARDVEAAINAARTYLPANLPTNPTYRKVNSAAFPMMILTMTSDVHGPGEVYDTASSIVQQRLSQLQGVGQVQLFGSSLPAVRVELNPQQLNSYGIGVQKVAQVLAGQNANRPKGQIGDAATTADITSNDQIFKARDFAPLVIGSDQGRVVRLRDVAQVLDSTQTTRVAAVANGKRAVVLLVTHVPNANVIATVDRIRAILPSLRASIPAGDRLEIASDFTSTIRASVNDVEGALVLSIVLVIAVVFIFLRSLSAMLIPGVAVAASLVGAFAAMYLLGFSVDNLSLMALTVSTGFVVDDAVVVMENIARLREAGIAPLRAALQGSREVSFTVLSMSASLVAVFIPVLFMGGLIGRLFHEFAMTLCVAIVVSMVVSLTVTPMMCVYLLKPSRPVEHGVFHRFSEGAFERLLAGYRRTLTWALGHPALVILSLVLTLVVNVLLLGPVHKGLFPMQDTGLLFGGLQGAQDASFQSMHASLLDTQRVIRSDPAVQTVVGVVGGTGGALNSGPLFVVLKPRARRDVSTGGLVDRLRPKLQALTGASTFMQAAQDIGVGGRQSNAQYQYQLSADTVEALSVWGPLLYQNMQSLPELEDVTTDQQDKGLQILLNYDRSTSARLGLTPQSIDQSLYDEFGEAEVSTMYTALNQYYVVMEAAPHYLTNPQTLRSTFVQASGKTAIPLQAVARIQTATSPLSVNHSAFFPSVTVAFNLSPGVSLGQATTAISRMQQRLGVPATVRSQFAGAAQAFVGSLSTEPLLILAALACIYIVLGTLYESLIHPITILTTLPSAGVGAVLSLLAFHSELDVISVIGIFLLIGIVKKNAILMIDFALVAERDQGLDTREAIFQAAMLRFRPILMTSLAAFFGALPLALGTGVGSELRQPLGVAICGGLVFSQFLTLYTTPVVYLYFDRLSKRLAKGRRGLAAPGLSTAS